MRAQWRTELLIFLAAFLAFAWFNQGGGWNQNSRFAEVRAIVEQGTFAIDSFLVYERGKGLILNRVAIQNGDMIRRGKTERLSWTGEEETPLPINRLPPENGMTLVPVTSVACSGDIAFARGHFHPNKPPGTSFVATPGYFLIYQIERWRGVNPDHWRVLTINAWLTSVLSVGVISALGCVIFFRLAKMFAPANAASTATLWATLTFAFGTLFFPFATLLFDHNLTATFLLAAFYWITPLNKTSARPWSLCLSGFAAGMAAIINYVASIAVVMLGVYLLATRRGDRRTMLRHFAFFCLGVLGPFFAICAYNKICYGSPFALSNDFQNPLFSDAPMLLGMFGVPQPGVALALLFSPFRGLFYSAPVLLLSVYSLLNIRKIRRAEFWLVVSIFALFFLVNSSFSGWHGGYSCGPRYLIPAIPFLALPLVIAFVRFPKLTATLAGVSFGINLLFTAVDAESPVGNSNIAYAFDRPQWVQSPLADFALPLFVQGRAWPLLNELIEEYLQNDEETLVKQGMDPTRSEMGKQREALRAAVARGDPNPLLLATIHGPVSVNPIGVYEASYYTLFRAGLVQPRWNSFNVGERFFPQSRWSLAPLLAALALLVALARRSAKFAGDAPV